MIHMHVKRSKLSEKQKRELAEQKKRDSEVSGLGLSGKYKVKYKPAKPAPEVLPLELPRATYSPGTLAKKESMKYTGNSMVGIATMHKSNSVPIFSQEEAQDVSRMRRG